MRQSYTAVVERAQPLQGDFETEPYEAGWAGEAVIFVRALEESDPDVTIQARVQLSPDGVHWVDEGTVLPELHGAGLVFARVAHFGNWLRVAGRAAGGSATATALVYIVLKE